MSNTSFVYDPQGLPEYIENLKSRLRIAVIYGGNKDTPGSVIYPTINPRPWKSYQQVAEDIAGALQELGFHQVCVLPDDMHIGQHLHEMGAHLAWLNTGGVQGYEPLTHTPALMEMLGIPYVGHDSLSAGLLDNKLLFKQRLVALGLPTPSFGHWSPNHHKFNLGSSRLGHLFARDSVGPFIVKPISGRASILVEVICSADGLQDAVEHIYETTRNDVLIEEFLPGREYCISMCGSVIYRQGEVVRLPSPFTFSALERHLEEGELIFTSMDKKAITKDRARLLDPYKDGEVLQRLTILSQMLYSEFNLSSLVRADLRADKDGQIYFLECNPKPDLKRPQNNVTSLATMGLEKEGMCYTDLIMSLLVDRLDFLFQNRLKSIQHLVDLIN
jgi:D-alanine-D-alanine ligase